MISAIRLTLSYNILIAMPSALPSSHITFSSMANILADHGHNVTFVSSSVNGPMHVNISNIYVNVTDKYETPCITNTCIVEREKKTALQGREKFWTTKETLSLYRNRNQFQLLISPMKHHEFLLTFVANTSIAYITFVEDGFDYYKMGYYSGNWMTLAIGPEEDYDLDWNADFETRLKNVLYFPWNLYRNKGVDYEIPAEREFRHDSLSYSE